MRLWRMRKDRRGRHTCMGDMGRMGRMGRRQGELAVRKRQQAAAVQRRCAPE